MMRVLTIVVILAAALAATADEQKPSTADKAEQKSAKPEAVATAQPDSPLVAAAKRSNRHGRKPANVITNESLKTVGPNAHVTSTTKQAPIQMPRPLDPPRPTPEMEAARTQAIQRKKAEEAAAAERKAAAARTQTRLETAHSAEEGLYDDESGAQDPAQAERAQQEANQPKPPQF